MSDDTDMKEIGLRMAKATPEDLEAAILLNGMLSDVFEDDQFPRGLDGEFSESDPDYFDEDDGDHLRALYRRLREVYRRRPGGMNRVIWGMDTIMNPANRIVDPDKDHLVPHPAIRWVDGEQKGKPRVVCLCGSTRFFPQFQEANFAETMAGNIVLSVGFYPHAVGEMHGEGVGITPDQKQGLDELHLRKIDLADEVLILNVGGYIGESTARELAYAYERGKAVRFLQPQPECD